MPLNIVLTTGKVPHKISPVHKVQLITNEKFDIFGKGRFHDTFCLAHIDDFYRCSFYLRPRFVPCYVTRFGAVHTREKHHRFADVFVLTYRIRNKIVIFFVFIFFYHTTPYLGSFTRNRCSVALALRHRHVGLAVDKRRVAILFTRQITAQGEDILRGILVHRLSNG